MFPRKIKRVSFLFIATIALALPASLLAATSSQYASGWIASGTDWTPTSPNPNPLGPPDPNCVGTSNAGTVYAEFSFSGFSIPGGDTIVGIEVNVNYRSVVSPTMQLKLSGSNVGMTRPLSATPSGPSTCDGSIVETAGGPMDTWGAGLTAANFNAGNVAVRLTRTTGPDEPRSLDIESVQIVVTHQGANGPPTAMCQNVTKSANTSCQASVAASEVNNGSTDPDGDPLTFSLSPSGPFSLGGTAVTLTVNDNISGTDSCGATVTVNDNTKPVISLNGSSSMTLECGVDTYTEPGATATDNCDSPAVVIGGDTVNPSTPGVYVVTYNAMDASGNAATQKTRTVTVSDTLDPVITLNGPASVTLECPAAYVEQGATAVDACAGPVAVSVVDNVDETTPGTYQATYTASDGNGNSAMATRTVIVEDTTDPVVTLIGDNPLVLECAVDTYVEPGATVVDACDQNPSLVISGTVDEGTPGDYPITYTGTDASGNSSMETRIVTVEDTLPPVITVSTDRFVLWPPNHKYHTIDLIDVVTEASDLCDLTIDADDVVLAEVASDEEENGKGDGNTVNDIVIAGGDCRSVDLRAERQGGSNGRVYTLDMEATDASDNVGTASSQVEVPHSKKDTAVDDGAAYSEDSVCASFKALMECDGGLDKAQQQFLLDAKGQCMALIR